MAYLSRAKLKFEAFCYFITYTTERQQYPFQTCDVKCFDHCGKKYPKNRFSLFPTLA